MKECSCSLRTKLVGDGCSVCNPTLALEYANETINDLNEENARLRAALKIATDALQDVAVGQLVNRHYKVICKRALNFISKALEGR